MDGQDVHLRLYKTPRRSQKPEKTANDAVISDLPAETLRWIKNRRRLDCDAKMVLSHNRERQLRDIFNGIDVGKHGSIDLVELNEAVRFVGERMKNRTGTFKGFDKIIEIFNSMDDNGDGEVDFREFTNAMSGSSKSALDKASEQDIANLHRCFLEFGVMKSRRHAIAKINEYTGLAFVGEKGNLKSAAHHDEEDAKEKLRRSNSDVVDDLKKYHLFRTLFEEKRDVSKEFSLLASESQDGEEGQPVKLTPDEVLLKEFQEENKRLNLEGCSDPTKEAELDALHERLKQARARENQLLARDPDALAMQAQQAEALR
jgi:Ca2+-binding EF-hand superfamily protein